MSNRLAEFINYINAKYENIDEEKQQYFRDFFSNTVILKQVFDDSLDKDAIYDFLKKINLKVIDLSVLKEYNPDRFYNDFLFSVNDKNIIFYSQLHKTNKYMFSCFMDNEKIFQYIAQNGSEFKTFCMVLLKRVVGFFNEDPKFLLLLLYAPSFDESLQSFFISNIMDNTIDYVDVFSWPKVYEKYVEIDGDFGDSICLELIRQNKLKLNWNNLIFLYRQLGPLKIGENAYLENYINSIVENNEKKLKQQSVIHKKLVSNAKNFLFFIFINENIRCIVLEHFVLEINNNGIFFVPDALIENEGYNLESEYRNWNFEKSIIILKCFLDRRFRGYEHYSLLICYLMKNNIYGILEEIDNLDNVSFKETQFICIYASLLYHSIDYEKQKKVFADDEINYILMKISLSLLNDVFCEWKLFLGDGSEQYVFFVNKILLFSAVEDKIINSIPEISLSFLNGLIGVADASWMERIIRKIDEIGYSSNNLDSHIFNKWYDSISKYIGERKDGLNREKEKEVFQKLWEKIPQIRSEMHDIIIIASDATQLEKIKDFRNKVNQLFVSYESKKQYLAFDKRSKLEKLINCFALFADRCVILCAKNKEMKIYEQTKNSVKIEECGKFIGQLMEQCQKYLDHIPLLYAEVEKML